VKKASITEALPARAETGRARSAVPIRIKLK